MALGTVSPRLVLVFGMFFWHLLVTVVPFLVVSWRMPNTYSTGGVKRGLPLKIHETREDLDLTELRYSCCGRLGGYDICGMHFPRRGRAMMKRL